MHHFLPLLFQPWQRRPLARWLTVPDIQSMLPLYLDESTQVSRRMPHSSGTSRWVGMRMKRGQ
eukprot:3109944-Rhodomonas_salina.1